MVGFLTFNQETEQYLVTAVLRPGNAPGSAGAVGILRRLIQRLREAFPKAKIRVRLDGGFRYIEILMISPWKVQLGRENGYPFSPKRKVQIARLTELFGGLALVLACVGVYGVTAYSVERRTNEIGIRMALGADRRNVLSLVLRAALTQIGLGLVIGVPAALAGSRVLASQLWGAKSYDPMIIAIAALVLAVCAIFAASLPARRATRVDPMVALRYE